MRLHQGSRTVSRRTRSAHRTNSLRSQIERLEDRTLLDGTGPRILSATPLDVRNTVFDHLDVTFNEPIDALTFTTQDVTIAGPEGPVSVTGVAPLAGDAFRITFPALATRGAYTATIGPDITDLAGNKMDQNQNGTQGEIPGDQFVAKAVYIQADTIFTAGTTITETNTQYDGQDIAIVGATVAIDGSHNFRSVQLVGGAVLTHTANTATQTHKLDLTIADQAIIDASSRIDVSGKGYLAGYTSGNSTAGGATGGAGGSHGGQGAFGPSAYDDYSNPQDWGSGGGTGSGGGLVRITAQSLTLDGDILANGSGAGNQQGAGAGGGVYVSVATIQGAGVIQVVGGPGGDFAGRGGGGGRIAVYSKDFTSFDLTKITAGGGQGGAANGGAGTVYVRDTDNPRGTLIIGSAGNQHGGGFTPLGLLGQTTVNIPDDVVVQGNGTTAGADYAGMTVLIAGSLTVDNGALLTLPDETHAGTVTVDKATFEAGRLIASSLSLTNGAILTDSASTAIKIYSLDMTIAGQLIIDATSKIDVSGNGYLAGRTTGNTTLGGAVGVGGGSHGGPGGNGPSIFDDYLDPEDSGAGGGGGAGGGLIRVTATTIDLDGAILAQGQDGSGSNGAGSLLGAGAGGGVYLVTGTLAGGGFIQARGGNTSDGNSGGIGGSGGGGRIAVYYQTNNGFDLKKITAPGGQARYPETTGGAGTVYLLQGVPHTHVRSESPAGVEVGFVDHGNGYVNHAIDSIVLKFNNPIDLSSFDPSEFVISGQMGAIQPTGMTEVGDRTYRIGLPFVLTENGPYHFTLLPSIRDTAGFPLDQNGNGTPGESDDGYSFDLTIDTVPPRLTQHTPSGDIAGTIDHVDVWFSEAIDTTTFTTSDIAIIKPNGQTIVANSIQNVGFNRYRLSFAAQTLVGTYHVRIGPDVRDFAGNLLDQNRDGIAGDPIEDVYDASFNIIPVDLGLNSLSISTTTLTAGEPITVSWSGSNQTGAPLVGNWTDGVYLSANGVWDINDPLLGTVAHTGGLTQGEIYNGSLNAVIPGTLPGTYHILVRSDVTNQERETNEANNVVVSSPLTLSVHALLSNGAASSGSLTSSDNVDYFAIQIKAGDNLSLVLNGLAASGVNELYASFDAIPTRLAYDFRSVKDETFVDRQDQTMVFTAPPGGGTYYVLVYGDQIDSSGLNPYHLSATTGPIIVTSITPDIGTNQTPGSNFDFNGQPVGRVIPSTVTITGAGFDVSTSVSFIGSDGVVRPPSAIHLVSQSVMTLALNLPDWPAGVYDVRVTKGSTSTTNPHAFTVVQGGEPSLDVNLVTPSGVGYNFPVKQTLWIEYRNAGDAPMPAPLLTLQVGSDGLITADPALAIPFSGIGGQPAGVTDTVQVMANGSGATPGILQPGDFGRVPIYWIGLSKPHDHPAITFSLSSLTADDVSHFTPVRILGWGGTLSGGQFVDWRMASGTTAIDALRPDTIPSDAWSAIWKNLSLKLQTNPKLDSPDWGDYVVALSSDLNYLHSIGQDTNDVGSLWSFEIAQASASLNPVKYLAGSVDAEVPAPGLSLSFSRVYGESIISRYKIGSLGRGWTDNWDISAEVQGSGDVVIHGPGGVDRVFSLNGNGTYRASAGDTGQLTSSGGAFRLTEADQTVWQFRTDGLLDHVADPNGNRITLGYTNGLLTSLTHSDGQQLLIDYNADGRIAHVTNPLGPGPADDLITTYAYGASGEHLVQVTQPGGRVTIYTYDSNDGAPREHALLSVKYPDGTHDHFAYDPEGRLISTSGDQAAQLVTYSYDTTGGVTVTDATGRATSLYYGLNGQVAQVRDGAGRVVNLSYNSTGTVSQLVGPSGEKYTYSYDTHGNLVGVRDPLRQTTTFTYDATFNQIASVTDPRGNGMQYAYDTHGNLTSITYADGTHENYTYDTKGNVLTATNLRGQKLTYSYNAAGEETSKDDPTTPGIDFTYTYDTAGNLTSATDSSGKTAMSYDPNTNLLTRIDYPGGLFFTFGYDSAGRRTKRTDQDGHVENSIYDLLGRLDTMTDENGALIVHYEYDGAGRLSKKTLGNGVYTLYVYNSAGQVTRLLNLRADGSVLSRFDYTYDASGLQSSMTTLDGTYAYGYDPLGQLTSVTYPDSHIVSYDYDAAGNRIQVDDAGTVTTYATNNLNQYTTVGDTTYTYDADGNMTSKTEGGVTNHYTYDVENRLVGVTTPIDSWTYHYDAFGNRIASTHNGVAAKYVIDPAGLGNVAAEYDGSGNLVARYDDGYGLLDRTGATGSSDYYTFSAIGNTSELTDPNGAVVNSYAYDPFGISLGKTEGVSNPFQFVGEYGVTNEGNGLAFMRARSYMSAEGRFIQKDAIGVAGGANLYVYAINSPVSYIDPSGFRSTDDPFAAAPANPVLSAPESPDDNQDGLLVGIKVGKTIWDVYEIIKKGKIVLSPFDPADYIIDPPSLGNSDRIGLPGPDGLVINGDDLKVNLRLPPDWNLPFFPPLPPGTPSPYPVPPVHSIDPNDKLGPAGFGDAAYIQSDNTLSYQVRFENESKATAPARRVLVTDTLDPNLDLNSLSLTEIDFANQTIAIPPGLDHYETTVPMIANGTSILVQITAALDRDTRQLTLTLDAVDPTTGTFPEDPLIGLLYPEDDTGRGMGSLSYIIKPLAGLPSGTVIDNRAQIIFDFNDPIDTPLVHNTLDAAAPTSSVTPLPTSTTAKLLTVSWSGQDEAGGSGVATYDVFLSVDGGPFVAIVTASHDTSISSSVDPGHTYAFYSIARDNVGHVESAPLVPDAVITVLGNVATTTTVQSSHEPSKFGGSVSFTAVVGASQGGAGTPAGSVQFRIDGLDFGSAVALVNGSASSPVIAVLTVGSHAVTASYIPEGMFVASTGSLAGGQSVAKADTTTVVSSSAPTSAYGQSVTFTATTSALTSGLPPLTGSVQFKIDGIAFGSSVTLVNGAATSTPVATLSAAGHTITAVFSGDANFATSTASDLLQTVSKAPLTVTADNKTKVSGQINPVFTASFGGFVLGQTAANLGGTLTFATPATSSSPPGTYPITPGGLTSGNYTLGFVPGTLTVIPKSGLVATTVILTPNLSSPVYGQSLTFTATVTPTLGSGTPTGTVQFLIGGVNFGSAVALLNGSATSTAVATLGAGAHAVSAVYSGDVAFATSSRAATSTVAKAPLTTTADNKTKASGQTNPLFTASYGGFVLGETVADLGGTLTFVTPATSSSPPGTYPITPGGLTSGNYALSFVPGTLTVIPKSGLVATTAILTPGLLSPIYGQSQTFTVTVTPTLGSGTPTGTVQFVIDGVDYGPAVGLSLGIATSTVIASLGAGGHSVSATYYGDPTFSASTADPITTTVAKAPLSVSAQDKTKVYGQVNPVFTATYGGFVLGQGPGVLGGTVMVTTAATPGSHVGSYPVTPAGLTSTNYAITFADGMLTITPAHLTVTADNKTRIKGTANPPLTYMVSGFVNGDTAAVLSGTPSLNTIATTASLAGTYPITVGLGTFSASNYDFPNFVNGSLTVTPQIALDFDGVGHTEMAVFRPATAQWFVMGPTGGRLLGTFGDTSLRDIPVPGDYDGVGHTEMAVFRPATAQWFVMGPTGGRLLGTFGDTSLRDIPVPGDYDGVGHTEMAVFRPATAQWFVMGPGGGHLVGGGDGRFGAQRLIDIPLEGQAASLKQLGKLGGIGIHALGIGMIKSTPVGSTAASPSVSRGLSVISWQGLVDKSAVDRTPEVVEPLVPFDPTSYLSQLPDDLAGSQHRRKAWEAWLAALEELSEEPRGPLSRH
jgi:RHS repeat-associated protein